MRSQIFRVVLVITLLLGGSMACSLFSGISEQVSDVRATVDSAATAVQKGQDVIATVQSAATEVMGSGFAQTVEAVATQQGPGLIATAQAFATEQGPGFIETAQAFATQEGPGFIETAQAFATQEGPGLLETAQAMATAVAGSNQAPPEDIPIVSGTTENLYTTDEIVTYITPLDFQSVLAFYQQEMPANGWEADSTNTALTANTAVLQYDKVDRHATITLSESDGKTVVLIIITSN
jgi:cytochrome c551/c552